jgi:diphthamide synthase (EF-2-diphthine--ammonia ligase)
VSGLRATITTVDPQVLDRSFARRSFDEAFIRDLPAHMDRCGENGEFHSFAWSDPMFERPLSIEVGEVVERDGFVFADVRRRDG